MSMDDDHEVIDSAAALFRHLSEAHDLEEARELDPLTTPVHPWLRRHADLERAARLAAARHREDVAPPAGAAPPGSTPAGITPAPAAADRAAPAEQPAAAFRDPLVEALARGLARRGHDERRLRAAIRAYASPDGRRHGEDGVRSELVGPLLDTLAAELDGRSQARAPAPGPSPAASPTAPRATPSGRPAGPTPEDDDVMALADAVQGRRGRSGRRAATARATPGDDDVMALADAVQRRRQAAGRG